MMHAAQSFVFAARRYDIVLTLVLSIEVFGFLYISDAADHNPAAKL